MMKERSLEQELHDGANDARSNRAPAIPSPKLTRVTSNSTKMRSFKHFRFWGLSRASKNALLSSSDGCHGKEYSNGSDADYGYRNNKYVIDDDDYCDDYNNCPLRRSLERTGFI